MLGIGAMRTVQPSSIDVIASTLGTSLPDLGAMSSPDGALTLLFTDIENAAGLGERLGEDRWASLTRDHHTMVNQLVSHHDGTLVKSNGDGHMAAFQSAHGGLRCAIEIQRTFSGGAVEDMRVRAGLHTGFVIVNGEDYMGRNVVLAARIADRAKGAEILVSSALKEYVETDPSFAFAERGEYHFKGLLGEHTVYGVDWAAAS
jgi:class 3 adenylate cyclase